MKNLIYCSAVVFLIGCTSPNDGSPKSEWAAPNVPLQRRAEAARALVPVGTAAWKVTKILGTCSGMSNFSVLYYKFDDGAVCFAISPRKGDEKEPNPEKWKVDSITTTTSQLE